MLSQSRSITWVGVAAANRRLRLASNFHAQLTLPMSLRSEMGRGKHRDCKSACRRRLIDVEAQSRTLRYLYREPVGHDRLGVSGLLSAGRGCRGQFSLTPVLVCASRLMRPRAHIPMSATSMPATPMASTARADILAASTARISGTPMPSLIRRMLFGHGHDIIGITHRAARMRRCARRHSHARGGCLLRRSSAR